MTTTDRPVAGEVPPGAPLAAALLAASDALARASAVTAVTSVWQVADADVLDGIRQVAALRGRLEGVYLDLVRELDGRGLAAASPVATTPEGFLRTTCLVGAGQARRDVAAARATAPAGPLAPFVAELSEGRRTRAHVDVAVRCLDRIPSSTLARPGAPQDVLDFLRTAADDASPLDMDRAARQLLARLDPDRADRAPRFDPDGHTRRFLDVHTDATGMVVGAFQLDPVSGATLRAALDGASAPVPGADGEPDRRQARQRRADALVRVAEAALGVATPRRGERPRVVVHVTPEQMVQGGRAGLGVTEGGDPLSPTSVRRLTCDAVLQRVVGTPSLGPLDVGREHRLVTPAQRRALAVRDGGCVVPGCGASPDWCDAHHVVHWADGGPSDVGNYVLLCPGHHTAVHAGTWQVSIPDGHVTVTPPRWVDPARRPRPVRHRVVETALTDLVGAGVDVADGVDPAVEALHDEPPTGARGVDPEHDGLADLFQDLPPAPRPAVGDDAVQRLLLAELFRSAFHRDVSQGGGTPVVPVEPEPP